MELMKTYIEGKITKYQKLADHETAGPIKANYNLLLKDNKESLKYLKGLMWKNEA